ncbi:MAG: hypothetical protein ACREV2_20405, partial [Burkholderiales bacterium]
MLLSVFQQMTSRFRAAIGALITLCIPLYVLASEPVVWLAPVDHLRRPFNPGTSDFMDLFHHKAPWHQAAARTKVLKLYAHFVVYGSDSDLARVFADLK